MAQVVVRGWSDAPVKAEAVVASGLSEQSSSLDSEIDDLMSIMQLQRS